MKKLTRFVVTKMIMPVAMTPIVVTGVVDAPVTVAGIAPLRLSRTRRIQLECCERMSHTRECCCHLCSKGHVNTNIDCIRSGPGFIM